MSAARASTVRSPVGTARLLLEMVKIEHTVFALPFALTSVVLAVRYLGAPHDIWRRVAWILAAMFAARSAAMTFNRLVDAKLDAVNPRTAMRHIPAGRITRGQAAAFLAVCSAALVFFAAQLNRLCLALSPVALGVLFIYSFTKRFTSLSHLVLGFAIGLSPVAAWIAVTGSISAVPLLLGGAVMLWIAGFDVIYALQDDVHDASVGLHSLPVRLGRRRALWLSRLAHLGSVVLLAAAGVGASCGFLYFAGVGVCALLIAYEHALVHPDDIRRVNVAFFTLNGCVSVALFLFAVADLYARHRP